MLSIEIKNPATLLRDLKEVRQAGFEPVTF